MSNDGSYRIVQWGTGNVGRMAAQAVLDRPDMTLVGCYVTSPSKHGQDVGAILGSAPTGVLATTDIEEIEALDADCVLHMPLPSAQVGDDPDLDTKVICRLLASGKNVVTTVGYVHPKAYGADVVGRIEAAATAGRSSLHGTGLNPGFMGELVPLALSGLCRRIDQVLVRESSEFSRYPSPEIILGMMGFGKPPDEFEAHSARYRTWLSGLFSESVLLVADGLGVELDALDVQEETALTDEELTIAAGVVPAGTVAAQRWTWAGRRNGTDLVRLEAIYKAAPHVAPDWTSPAWVTRIEGQPRIVLEADRWITNGLLATAMHAVHAVTAVCAAAPGIRTFLDLPLIIGRHTAP
jgi:hypothetical protein